MAGVRLVDDHLANPRLEMEGEWFTSSSGVKNMAASAGVRDDHVNFYTVWMLLDGEMMGWPKPITPRPKNYA
uniref:Uncharacterized protein n=1 Tax=Oryza meridionalis TaxID=40149 RepID=A0A0E0CCM4_9ORYZ